VEGAHLVMEVAMVMVAAEVAGEGVGHQAVVTPAAAVAVAPGTVPPFPTAGPSRGIPLPCVWSRGRQTVSAMRGSGGKWWRLQAAKDAGRHAARAGVGLQGTAASLHRAEALSALSSAQLACTAGTCRVSPTYTC
jgi:hypothetical protein